MLNQHISLKKNTEECSPKLCIALLIWVLKLPSVLSPWKIKEKDKKGFE